MIPPFGEREVKMASKILITLGVLVYGGVVPYLEINATHVFNPEWPPHARLHEVWQLITHCGIGVLCLWLVWVKGETRIPSLLNILVMGGVLVAHAIEDSYGGSLITGNFRQTVLGMELAAFAAAVVVVMAVAAYFLGERPSPTP